MRWKPQTQTRRDWNVVRAENRELRRQTRAMASHIRKLEDRYANIVPHRLPVSLKVYPEDMLEELWGELFVDIPRVSVAFPVDIDLIRQLGQDFHTIIIERAFTQLSDAWKTQVADVLKDATRRLLK
ncbi:MAG TPA: hypothetical protein VMZ31_16865 [Phycisphaerae bacterium]|nr:hypothetical protein [Phycisphaerae bacterium]